MTGLLITRQDIIDCDVCSGGLSDFDEVFPSGVTDTETLLAECAIKDETHNKAASGTNYTLWAKVLIRNKYGISTGKEIVSMNEKYQVFNPLTGQHTECATMAEVLTTRQSIIDEYVQSQITLFHVSQEAVNGDGDTVWTVLSEEQLVVE